MSRMFIHPQSRWRALLWRWPFQTFSTWGHSKRWLECLLRYIWQRLRYASEASYLNKSTTIGEFLFSFVKSKVSKILSVRISLANDSTREQTWRQKDLEIQSLLSAVGFWGEIFSSRLKSFNSCVPRFSFFFFQVSFLHFSSSSFFWGSWCAFSGCLSCQMQPPFSS